MLKLSKATILAIFLVLGTISAPTFDDSLTVQAQNYIQLTPAQMKSVLQCPTDESKQFIDDCFKLAALGKIPESLILSAFQYALEKEKNRWVYFQKSLTMRCSYIGIDLASERAKLHDD